MIIAVGSIKGSPGATTLSVALADRWPRDGGDPLVVEADPAGGDLAARFGLAPTRGLVSLAAAARRGGAGVVDEHLQQLPGGLPVVAGPAGAEQARQVLAELGAGWSWLWAAARADGHVVIVDCGRLDPQSPAAPAVRAADVVLLVVRDRTDELAQLAARLAVVQGWALPAWYVVVVGQADRSAGYAIRDISRALGERVLGPVPHDPSAAGVLAGRRRSRSGIGRSALGRSAGTLAGYLTTLGAFTGSGRPALPAAPDDAADGWSAA